MKSVVSSLAFAAVAGNVLLGAAFNLWSLEIYVLEGDENMFFVPNGTLADGRGVWNGVVDGDYSNIYLTWNSTISRWVVGGEDGSDCEFEVDENCENRNGLENMKEPTDGLRCEYSGSEEGAKLYRASKIWPYTTCKPHPGRLVAEGGSFRTAGTGRGLMECARKAIDSPAATGVEWVDGECRIYNGGLVSEVKFNATSSEALSCKMDVVVLPGHGFGASPYPPFSCESAKDCGHFVRHLWPEANGMSYDVEEKQCKAVFGMMSTFSELRSQWVSGYITAGVEGSEPPTETSTPTEAK